MASGGSLVRTQSYTPVAGAPSYLADAVKDIGIQEWVLGNNRKKVSNPVVERYIAKVNGSPLNAIDTPWCAYFVGAKLEYAGITSSKSGMARSYLSWGVAVADNDWKAGDVVVFKRNTGTRDDHVLGHVAFLLRWDNNYVYVLGGNQGDRVCIEAFPRGRIIGVRRPRTFSKTIMASVGSVTSQTANKGVENFIPDQSAVHDAALQAHSLVSPSTGKVPSPDELQAAYDSAHPYLTMLAHMKPEIIAVLTILSLGLAAYAGWCRYKDWIAGRTGSAG
jgi:uncharacterized protein (TIGR02594 family)